MLKDNNIKIYNQTEAVKTYLKDKITLLESRLFDQYFKKPAKVLDLGCGTGRTSRYLFKLKHTVTAVDYSKAMIKYAKQLKYGNKIKYMVMNAKNLSFASNYFDYVLFSFNGIDYLYPDGERKKALKEISRVLKPGGCFIFSSHNATFVPNTRKRVQDFLKSLLKGELWEYRWDFQVFGPLLTRYISLWSQQKQLIEAGFEEIKVCSSYGNNELKIALVDPYPSYVCFKPK